MEKKGTNDVVLHISSPEESLVFKTENDSKGSYELTQFENLRVRVSTTLTPIPSPSHPSEIARMSPVPNKPPKIPIDKKLTPRKSLARSAFSKPKSRLVEPSYLNDAKLVEENSAQILNPSSSPYRRSPAATAAATPKENLRSAPITPKTPLISPGLEEEDEEEEVYKTADLKLKILKQRRPTRGNRRSSSSRLGIILPNTRFLGLDFLRIRDRHRSHHTG